MFTFSANYIVRKLAAHESNTTTRSIRQLLRLTKIGSCSSSSSSTMATAEVNWKNAQSIYEFNALDIDGNKVSLDKYRGKVCLIVNVASKCGFTTKNYTQLQALHTKYAEMGLAILGFPSNEFGGQEPGSNEEIKKFVTEQFNVQFDMFSKIEVNGKNAHPLYKYLKHVQKGTLGDDVTSK
uniref:Glutathione peroxidase n=1 Tax=Biomphalaria glabrata TaxID=6526 RepID=A0A2C9JBF9_BIOGL